MVISVDMKTYTKMHMKNNCDHQC